MSRLYRRREPSPIPRPVLRDPPPKPKKRELPSAKGAIATKTEPSPHIRTIPLTPDDKPAMVRPGEYLATEKQARFKETVMSCVAADETTFPQWRLAHWRRCNERVTNAEWVEWGIEPAFTKWLTEDVTWEMTPADHAMMETHYQTALSGKLKAGGDTKALELYAKQTRKIGDQPDSSGSNVLVLLNWARGLGATENPKIIDGHAEVVDSDPWGAARITEQPEKTSK